MMILSRIWYVVLALLLAAAYYVVSLAVGQYNRRNQAAMDETLKADTQVVGWSLQLDARRRLDSLYLAAGETNVVKALRNANQKDPIPPPSKDEGAKALKAFNDKISADYKSDVLMLADRDGRLIAQIGFDQLNAFPEFELGGYAAVFDALHGFLRDDTWVLGGRMARVVTRPVEDEVGQAPLGAIVALRWVDNGFAKEVGKRTRTNVAFFALGKKVASAATTEGFEENALEVLGDLSEIAKDPQWEKLGRTDVRPLGTDDKGGVIYARLAGDSWELGGGFAVARPKVSITTPLGFLNGADDQDKRNVKLWIVALIVVGTMGLGLLFSFLEHSAPLHEMGRQAAKLKRGETDTLQLARFRGGYRPIASDINDGIQRIVEKGGGTVRKPADLESILGPVPAQPNMSAFSFPMQDGSMAPHQPGAASSPGGPSLSQSQAGRFPGAPPQPGRPPPVAPGPVPPAMGSRPGGVALPTPAPAFRPQMAPPMPAPIPAAGSPPNAGPIPNTAPVPFPSGMSGLPLGKDEDEQTMVAQPSADLINAAGGEGSSEWKAVYEEFLRTKKDCGEPTDGLTFDKFQQTLKKNRDALMQRHGCKRVKFSVYVKEGRASLKATPVRD